MPGIIPYCGTPPVPGELIGRFNLDPGLLLVLGLLVASQLRSVQSCAASRRAAAAGWAVAAATLISPLCALSVALFSARVAQHMILLLVAAPLVARGLPRWYVLERPAAIWGTGAAFLLALWFWHMPVPYEATFASASIYWSMHASLVGSGIALWAALQRGSAMPSIVAGTATSIHMGLLGAVICLASWPMYRPHYATSMAWGLTPLADQQLGGVLMWVPGCLLFLWAALRTLSLAWAADARVAA